jgi:hypothetical protein
VKEMVVLEEVGTEVNALVQMHLKLKEQPE